MRHTLSRDIQRSEAAAGRALEEQALIAAVIASIRHNHTDYDERLMGGADRADARISTRYKVEEVLNLWRS